MACDTNDNLALPHGLRRARAEDAPRILALKRRAYARHAETIGAEPSPMQADYARFIAEDEVWVADGEDGPTACLVLQTKPDHLVLWSLAVAPERQTGGVGRRLLDFTEERARALGFTRIRLFTNMLMTANRAWYERRGYVEMGLEDLGSRGIVHMVKDLSSATAGDTPSGPPLGALVDTIPARRPERGLNLEGRFVRLAPLDPAEHGDALYENAHGPEKDRLHLYLSRPPAADRAAFGVFLEKAAGSMDPFFYAVVDRTTGLAVGHAAYMRIEPQHRVIEVGNILYTPALARTAGATEAMHLMAKHAFEVLGYRRYEWKCDALNEPSRRAAARFGFVYEGTFRQHMIIKGRNRDTAWFSMLDADWPRIKAEFERWLAPENFDEAGRQKTRLAM